MAKIELTCPFCKNSNIVIRRNMDNQAVCADCTKDDIVVILTAFLPGERISNRGGGSVHPGSWTDKQRRDKFAEMILDKRLYFRRIAMGWAAEARGERHYQLRRAINGKNT